MKNNHSIFSRLVALFLICSFLPVSMLPVRADAVAASGACGDNDVHFTLYDDGLLVIEGSGKLDGYMIADRYAENYHTYAPWSCYYVSKAEVRSGITEVGSMAFAGMDDLTSVSLPETLTSFGENVFARSCKLESITVSEENPVFLSVGNCLIEKETKTLAAGCKASVIPNDGSVQAIAPGAFYDQRALTDLVIPDSVDFVGENAFYNTPWLSAQPEGVVYAGNMAYAYNGGMAAGSALVLKDGCSGITDRAFYDCKGLGSITIPPSVNYIGAFAFCGCSGLTVIDLPEGVETICGRAFQDCKNLTAVTIPEGVTRIEELTFGNCVKLAEITVPDSVEYINPLAFDGTKWYKNQPNGVVYAGNVAYKLKGSLPYGTRIVLKDGCKSVSAEAFRNCMEIVSVTAPEGLLHIDHMAFSGCTNLAEIRLPHTLKQIDSYAFDGCVRLSDVYYSGSETDWQQIEIGAGNKALFNADRFFTDSEYKTSAENYPIGDVDFDGRITAADARLALRACVKLEYYWNRPENPHRIAADADRDGVLSAADARKILRVSVRLETLD